jgi:hypothetical protein
MTDKTVEIGTGKINFFDFQEARVLCIISIVKKVLTKI